MRLDSRIFEIGGDTNTSSLSSVARSIIVISISYLHLSMQNVLSLEDQLKLFKGYINKLETTVGESTTSTIISQSLYLVCTGSNDITNSFFGSPITRLQYDISTYTDLMVNWASSFVQVITKAFYKTYSSLYCVISFIL